MMKIAMYAPSWPPSDDSNGIVTYLSHIVPGLRRLGHEVYVLTFSPRQADPHTVDLRGFLNSSLVGRASGRLNPVGRNAKAISRAVKHLAVDVLEIEESFGMSKAVSDVPVIVRLHGPWFLNGNQSDKRRIRLEGCAIKAADFVTAPSVYVLNEVVKRYSLSSWNKKTLNAAYLPNPISIPESRWDLSRCDQTKLLFVGRFDRIKGGDTVIKAFGRVADIRPDVSLTFVGPDRGIVEGGRIVLFQEYAKRVLPPDILSRVEFRGPLPRMEVEELRKSHFVTLFASEIEIFGYSALEAMALGCPVVASSAVAELINDGRSGLLFSPRDDEQMAAAIERLLASPQLAAQLGAQARLSAGAYSVANAASHTIDYYMQAVEPLVVVD